MFLAPAAPEADAQDQPTQSTPATTTAQPESAASTEPETPAPPPPSTDPRWTLQLEPAMWYVAASGKLKLPISSGSGPGSFTTAGNEVDIANLNLDSARLEPAGEFHLNSERWRFTLSAATLGLDHDSTTADSSFRLGAVPVAAGDQLAVKFDFTTLELTGGYRVYGRDFKACSPDQKFCIDAVTRAYILLGARFYDVSFDITNRSAHGAPSANFDQFFGEPIVGLRLEADFAEDFTIDVQVSGGGYFDSDRSNYSIDVIAGFQWRPTRHIGLQIGYRQLAFGLFDGEDAEEFSFDGRLAGLYAGLVIRF